MQQSKDEVGTLHATEHRGSRNSPCNRAWRKQELSMQHRGSRNSPCNRARRKQELSKSRLRKALQNVKCCITFNNKLRRYKKRGCERKYRRKQSGLVFPTNLIYSTVSWIAYSKKYESVTTPSKESMDLTDESKVHTPAVRELPAYFQQLGSVTLL